MPLSDYTDDLKWLQAQAKELAADDPKHYKGVNFFQLAWGYKEVALFLGIAPKTVLSPEFRRRLPAIALWQSEGTAERTGQQVLKWNPNTVIRFREEREQKVISRLHRAI